MHPRCICDVCDFMAEHAYVIKRHMMRHNADGCRCDICGKVYKVSMLYSNINYHTYYCITGLQQFQYFMILKLDKKSVMAKTSVWYTWINEWIRLCLMSHQQLRSYGD